MFQPNTAHLGDQAKLALQESTMVQTISRGKHALQLHFTSHLQNCGCEGSCVAQLSFTSHWPPWRSMAKGGFRLRGPGRCRRTSLILLSLLGHHVPSGLQRRCPELLMPQHPGCGTDPHLLHKSVWSVRHASIHPRQKWGSPELVTNARHQSNSRL